MYNSSSILSRRPRGFSEEPSIPELESPSILPRFLRKLSSPEPEDSYDRVEMNGNGVYMNGQGGRYQAQLGNFGLGGRGRVFKILGGIICFLTLLYLLLPWGPPLPSIGISFG